MKLIASGVTFSAAIVRSPSFSRSSSSTTMIISPARMASTASSIGANGERLLPRHFEIALQCDDFPRSGMPVSVRPASSAARTTYLPTMSHSRLTRSRICDATEVRVLHRERHDLHVEAIGPEPGDGQADAVDRDRALVHDVRRELRREAHRQPVKVGVAAAAPRRGRSRRRGPARSGRRSGRRRAAGARD